MSYELCQRIKNVVEYDHNNYHFNHQIEALGRFLREECENSTFDTDAYSGCLSDSWEIFTPDLRELCDKIENGYFDGFQIAEGYSNDEVAKIFRGWIANVEEHPENFTTGDDIIYLDWL